jgi:tetratricopeptide (TPR) repeat protein
VVNTASRLQGVAPVDGIAVGQGTFLATKEIFEYEELEPVELKGKAEPVPIWRATAARSRFGTDLTRGLATPMVGRELERALLTGTFDRSVRDQSVHLLTIVGEPGVGKSRLVAELFAHIDSLPDVLVTWRQGRCLPYGDGITFWALGEVVKAHAGILDSDSPDAASEKLDRVLPEGSEREWMRQRLLPLLGLEASSTADREEAFTAWRKFLESVAEDRPAIFVFEDLHWADEAMLAFLAHVVDYAEGVPMFLVCTARPELYERAPAWAASARNSNRINLGPLSEAETACLVSNLLDQTLLPAQVQSLILERAEGNPLYAEEFVRLLKDRAILVRKGSTWELDPREEIPLPSGVQGIIAARLDTLAPERKAMLQAAAVVGKVFWAGAVAAMGGWEPRPVAEALHELSRKELVRPTRASSVEGEAEYSFWHILVRDVAYAQIPRAERAERHRRAATWIEQVSADRIEDLAEVLAHHYSQALDLAKAAGRSEQARELEAPALRYLTLAGERALGLDTSRAEANLARALELAPPGHPSRPEVLAKWADAVRTAGRQADAAAALEEAIASFRSRGEVQGAARAMTILANVFYQLGDTRGRDVVAEAVELLEPLAPGPDLVAAYAETARQRVLSGETSEGIEWAERALSLAADLGLAEPAKPLGYKGLARTWMGDAGGLKDMRQALALATERGQGREAAVLYNNISAMTWPIEGPTAALGTGREGIAFAEARGMAEYASSMALGNLDYLFELGRGDEATAAIPALAKHFEATGSVANLMGTRQAEILLLSLRGRAADALPLVDWLVQTARATGSPEALVGSLYAAGMALAATGHPEKARALLEEVEERPGIRQTPQWAPYLSGMIRTAVACGDLELAERLASGLEPVYPYREHALVTASAILADARGETEAAADLYADAAERWERFGVVPEQGFALLGQGRSLLALGRDPEALGPLRQAREIFSSLQAAPVLAETDALLAQAMARSS